MKNAHAIVPLALAISSACWAQTAPVAVPPSRTEPEAWQGITSTSEFEAAETINGYKGYQDMALRGAARAGKDKAAEEVLEKVGKPFQVLDKGMSIYQVGEDVIRGDTAAALEHGTEFVIDRGVESLCAGAGPGALPCEVSYEAGKLVGDQLNKHFDARNKINKHIYEPLYDKYQRTFHPENHPEEPEFWERIEREHQERKQRQRDDGRQRFEQTVELNRQAREEQERLDAQAALSTADSTQDNNSAMSAFTDLLGAAANEYVRQEQLRSLAPVSRAPASAPTANGCHSGHDESAHPGGCHEYR